MSALLLTLLAAAPPSATAGALAGGLREDPRLEVVVVGERCTSARCSRERASSRWPLSTRKARMKSVTLISAAAPIRASRFSRIAAGGTGKRTRLTSDRSALVSSRVSSFMTASSRIPPRL